MPISEVKLGDLVTASEWTDMVKEINSKTNRAGDTFSGALTVDDNLTAKTAHISDTLTVMKTIRTATVSTYNLMVQKTDGAGKLTTDNLAVSGKTQLDGEVHMTGNLTVDNLTVTHATKTGKLTTDTLTVKNHIHIDMDTGITKLMAGPAGVLNQFGASQLNQYGGCVYSVTQNLHNLEHFKLEICFLLHSVFRDESLNGLDTPQALLPCNSRTGFSFCSDFK